MTPVTSGTNDMPSPPSGEKVVTRKVARAHGQKFYTAGRPCRAGGHSGPRYTSTAGCVECRNRSRPGGLRRPISKELKAAYAKKHRANRSSEIIMLEGAKRRSKKSGLPCDITCDDIVIPDNCPVLKEIVLRRKRDGEWHWDSPTLDRIDNRRGYVRGNVRVISFRANKLKSDQSLDQVLSQVEYQMTVVHAPDTELARRFLALAAQALAGGGA